MSTPTRSREERDERKALRILCECREGLLKSVRKPDITTRDFARCARALRQILEGIRETHAALKRFVPTGATVTKLDEVRAKRVPN